MPLDPLVQSFLLHLGTRPKAWEVSPDEARAGFQAMVKTYGARDVPVGKVETVTIPGPGGALALRLYTPVAAGGEALPVLVYFHGGAFRHGDFEAYESTCRFLAAAAACRVIAVDYRRAPEHPFPAAVEDAYAATRYIEANAAQFGVDPNRLAVGGDSAGGNLAAVVSQRASGCDGPSIILQLLLFPVTQFGADFPSLHRYGQGFNLDRDGLEYCYGLYAPPERWSDIGVSPLLAENLDGAPLAYVMLAECDPLHDEGLAYAQKLRQAGVTVTIEDWPGMIHDFILYQAVLPQAREALVAAAAALRAAFDAA